MANTTNLPTGTPVPSEDGNKSILKSDAVKAVVKAVSAGLLAATVGSQILATMGCGKTDDEQAFVDSGKTPPAEAGSGGSMGIDAGGGSFGIDAGGGCSGIDSGHDGCAGVPCMGVDAGKG